MGFISRKVFPACGSMCVCCPALRSRSRQPVKRYKKLLADIFPRSLDDAPSERKIVKLCEYALKNPFRLPKIAKYLEEKCYRELKSEQIKLTTVVVEAYAMLLGTCKQQIAYFASSVLNVVSELLENSNQPSVRILGCQMLAKFIYCQGDETYTHNIEKLVHKVCACAREGGDEHHKRYMRASSLHCLSAMVWFMAEFSHIFANLDEVIDAVLDNYELEGHDDHDDERGESHHNWVDEVVRCEKGIAWIGNDGSPTCMALRPQPEKKDPALFTREDSENPKVWAQFCIQRMADLAKEGTTMRRILDPIFVYFDIKQHWFQRQGLAWMVLSDMAYLMESTGNQHLVLAGVIRHLDHKNVAQSPQTKSHVIRIATALAHQIRSRAAFTEIGFVSDLFRHLRKSLQDTIELVGDVDLNENVLLQNSIEQCLLEITKGINDIRPLLDLMATTLEKIPPAGGAARAIIGSTLVLAHMFSFASVSLRPQQVFPEALFLKLLNAMSHPDVEARLGAHQIFSVLLVPNCNHFTHEVSYFRCRGHHCEQRRWHSDTGSTFASITALLEKLQREKDGIKFEKNTNNAQDGLTERDTVEEDSYQGKARKISPNFCNISSIVERKAGSSCFDDMEPFVLKFTKDQIDQLLSSFWAQATSPNISPSDVKAVAHSFCLTLISSSFKNPNHNLMIRFFQLPLSLRNKALDPTNGILLPACQRLLLVLSTSMLLFAAKICQISHLNDVLKPMISSDVDPYVGINDDLQLYLKPQVDVREYKSFADNKMASSLLSVLRNRAHELDKLIMGTLVQSLCRITGYEADDLARQLAEPFTPDDANMFLMQSSLENLTHFSTHSKDSSFDEDIPSNSLVECDTRGAPSITDLSLVVPRDLASTATTNVASVGKILESALELAGQVVGTSVSTSLPYSTMASHCETFGEGSRKKLSNWLVENCHNLLPDRLYPAMPVNVQSVLLKITCDSNLAQEAATESERSLSMKLPPASPFDSFLRTARCERVGDIRIEDVI